MTSRRRRAKELSDLKLITPANAIRALSGNLYRTHAQKASAKNFEETTAAIVTYIRPKYHDAADEVMSNREVVLTRPKKPRKPKKKKAKRVKIDDSVKVEEVESGSEAYITPKTSRKKVKPPPLGSGGIFKAEEEVVVVDEDGDSSEDESEDDAQLLYEAELEDYDDERADYRERRKKLAIGRKYARDVILAQCTREMKLKVKESFEEMKENSDVLALLGLIRTCGLDYSNEGYVF